MCGEFTQFGMRYKSRLLSKATPCGLPNFRDCVPRGALRMVRTGAASPFAVTANADAEEFPILATQISLFFASKEMPIG